MKGTIAGRGGCDSGGDGRSGGAEYSYCRAPRLQIRPWPTSGPLVVVVRGREGARATKAVAKLPNILFSEDPSNFNFETVSPVDNTGSGQIRKKRFRSLPSRPRILRVSSVPVALVIKKGRIHTHTGFSVGRRESQQANDR